ncbi:MAG TPA: malto-oligosyltrehalose synthase [Dermatophilaceae bacterium]|nr:malto-oligosyltrehalose synthase [Dermatophilaceae bacterium]
MTGDGSPISTLRLQLEPRFTLHDAAAHAAHFASLGVSHLYLSPILQASPGSTHGYDVVDHSRVAEDLGGEEGFSALVAAAHANGLGIVVDVVPNHMTTPTPLSRNAALWSVLREGRESPYATWFDIDWDVQGGRILMPVLGGTLDSIVAAGRLAVGDHAGETVVRYFDHVFPVAPGTERMPLGELLEAQHYRLADWRLGGTELNYRRFFDVTSLIAVRVEEPEVFDATHAHLVGLVREGAIDGLRIDHPDGLADPGGYLERLAEQTGGAWVVVEKILEGHEALPRNWACAGTTGYDALLRVGGLFLDPEGEPALTALSRELLGEEQDLGQMVTAAKEYVVANVLEAEVNRLLRLMRSTRPDLREGPARRALEALLVAMDRYRAYLRPGEDPDPEQVRVVRAAAVRARAGLAADDHPALDAVVQLALGEGPSSGSDAADDFVVRFQQTCGPVMAKGIEDTTFYRHVRLTSLNEVGGDPARMGLPAGEFHDFCQALARDWPTTMTTLSTHDTKRSEDVRARLAVLSERTEEWADWLRTARAAADPYRSSLVDPATEYLLWQALVGAWPVTTERLAAYATKATKEAKLHTSWTDPDTDYEAAVEGFVTGIVEDPDVVDLVEGWHAETSQETRANVLGQKIVQLTMPGVPDVYQGTDLVDLSLVDPDNRRPVDHAAHAARLARLDAGTLPASPSDLDDEKLLVTVTALRLRREHPEVFVGAGAGHLPLSSSSDHLVAYARGPADAPALVVLATRLAGRLADRGGWADATVRLPEGEWREAFSGRTRRGGEVPVSSLLTDESLPVALLTREKETS